jgi:YidC/Oxa1 family membrane protein insertase
MTGVLIPFPDFTMDTQRIILFVVFTFSLFLLWDAWQREHGPKPETHTQTTGAEAPKPSEQLVPLPQATSGSLPVVSVPPPPDAEKVSVRTDVLKAEIGTLGGNLLRLEFSEFTAKEDSNKPFVLLEQTPQIYVAQSGLIGEGLPSHKTPYTADSPSFELAPGSDKVEVRLAAADASGLKVSKIYTFYRSSYLIDLRYEILSNAAAPVTPYAYFQFLRDGKPAPGDTKMVPTYTGAAVYTEQGKYHKVDFAAIEKGKADYPKTADNGWIAMVQHYFVAAWLPEGKASREFFTRKVGDDLYSAGLIVPVGAVQPGQTGQLTMRLYAGPQVQDKLAKLAPGLNLVVDYGWLTFIAVPLFWVLEMFHKWVGNWGVAIILLTVMIKLIFYPLSAASYKSMAKMKAVAPKLQRIKELYGDDRQRLHQAMMDLYKTEKINPMGGCLPIVVQIPVFISLYWVLLQSVELRQAPFMLWIHDLSAADPYYVLPIVMGVTMIIQSRLNPTPPDPIQARMMQIMPIAFSVFFFFFPAGLVLYWLINNVLSIAQQWWINRTLGEGKARA